MKRAFRIKSFRRMSEIREGLIVREDPQIMTDTRMIHGRWKEEEIRRGRRKRERKGCRLDEHAEGPFYLPLMWSVA